MKRILIGLGIAAPVFLIGYYLLGGFEPLEFITNNSSGVRIIGKSYVGVHNSVEISTLFDEFRSITNKYRKDSSIVIVSFNKGSNEDSVNYFIGISMSEDSIEGFRTMEFHPKLMLTVWLTGHPIVLPSAEKLFQMAESKSEELHYKLSGYSIESYFPDGRIRIDFPMEIID